MGKQIEYFNSQETARILGVNVSTIKRWTDEGKLDCIKTAGGHRKFLMQHLADFLEENYKRIPKAPLFPVENIDDLEISRRILNGEFDFLQKYVLKYAFEVNRHRLNQILTALYLGQFPLHKIFDELLTPVLHIIGDLWYAGEIAVAEEHLASQSIRDAIIRLQGIIKIPKEKNSTALLLNLSGELHDIALKMVDHILEERGFNVLFSGQFTPGLKIEQVFSKSRPQRLYISSLYIDDLSSVQEELNYILDISQEFNTRVYIGGSGFDKLSYNHPSVEKRLNNFSEVAHI